MLVISLTDSKLVSAARSRSLFLCLRSKSALWAEAPSWNPRALCSTCWVFAAPTQQLLVTTRDASLASSVLLFWLENSHSAQH